VTTQKGSFTAEDHVFIRIYFGRGLRPRGICISILRRAAVSRELRDDESRYGNMKEQLAY